MRTSAYNNPMLAQGLGSLIQSFIGNPQVEAQSQLMASQALLNNQTAGYRDAMGNAGLEGQLGDMLIRSLQAGPDYSRYAPGIAEMLPNYAAQAVMGMPQSAAPRMAGPAAPAEASATDPEWVDWLLGQAATGTEATGGAIGSGASSIGDIISNFDPMAGFADMGRNYGTLPGMAPSAGNPDAAAVLAAARQAIAGGKDPKAVQARLIELGIDPKGL